MWEPSPKDSSASVNGKKPVTEKEPARRVIFELTTKERPFVRRNLDDGSKLIIDGDVYALYMAMLKWVQSHEIRRDGDLTRTGRKIVEMAEAIRDRNGGEKQPENCALRLELTDEEREYIKENVLFGERILHEGNLDRLCARLTRMANDRMARGDQGEEYCKLLSMCDAISLRNTSRKERLDVTEEEFQFIQENIERGITWVCGRKLDKLNRNLMVWIFENCVDENRTLTPEGERIHQMRKAIFRRNNKRTDLA